MGINKNTKPETMNIYEAIQHWYKGIDVLLLKLESPSVVNNKIAARDTKNQLKELLKEAITNIQACIIVDGNSKGVLQNDPTGFTTCSSIYSSDTAKTKFKNAHLVDVFAKQILDEQAKAALKEGVLISEAQLQQAKEDINDNSKETVTIETLENESGEASKLVVNKETGDTDLYEKDKKTGLWKKIGNTAKGFWTGIKNGFKSVINWCCNQWSRFTTWFKSKFSKPNEKDVIKAS